MLYSFVTLPTPASIIASTTVWSTEFFTSLIGLISSIAGISIGLMFVGYLVGKMSGGLKKLIGRKGRGRRGR